MSSPNGKVLIPSPPQQTNKSGLVKTAPSAKQKSLSPSAAAKSGIPEYERISEAQGRALKKWNKQQGDWSHVSQVVAQKARKPENATLSATTHLFRAKVEETGKLDAAVPQAARSHQSNSWEMGLRNGASATRYEPVGSSYPFPLYCPIKAPDQVSPNHPSLTHILYPPNVTEKVSRSLVHAKPVMESQFFKSRQAEFSHHINKKFGHFQVKEYFDVQGAPAPRTNEPLDESAVPQSAVQFIPMENKNGNNQDGNTNQTNIFSSHHHQDQANATHAITIRNLIAAQQQQLQQTAASVAPLTSVARQQQLQLNNANFNMASPSSAEFKNQQTTIGPQIVLSTNNLSFTTNGPDEIKQAIVTLDNTGSTAIYYQWSALPAAPAVLVNGLPGHMQVSSPTTTSDHQQQQQSEQDASTLSQQHAALTPSTQMASPFSLANPVTGSVLPESMKMFCFSFRAKSPGIYLQHMELITVPSGRERIVVTLRGVALAPEVDPISCGAIESGLNQACQVALAEEILRGDIVNKVRENVFAVADAALAVRKREAEIQAQIDAPIKLRQERKIVWNKARNKSQHQEQLASLPFCEAAYAALEQIRFRCNEFRSEFEADLAPSKTKIRQQNQQASEASKRGGPGAKDASAHTPRGKKGDDDDSEPAPDRAVQLVGPISDYWNGSLRGLYEDVSVVRTPEARNLATDAVSAIHRSLVSCSSNSVVSSSSSALDTTSLSDIIWLSAGRTWLGNAFDKFERASLLASARVEGRAISASKGINVFGVQPKKGPGGGAVAAGDRATTPVHALGADLFSTQAQAQASGPGASRKSTNPKEAAVLAALQQQQNAAAAKKYLAEEIEEETELLKEDAIKQLLLGAVIGMISSHDKDMELIEAATVVPLSAVVIDNSEIVKEYRDLDAEPILDLNNKKRK